MKKNRLQELAGIKEYKPQFQQAGAGISTNRDTNAGDRELQLNKAFLTDDGFGAKPNHTRGIQPATAQQMKKQYHT